MPSGASKARTLMNWIDQLKAPSRTITVGVYSDGELVNTRHITIEQPVLKKKRVNQQEDQKPGMEYRRQAAEKE